MKESRFWWAFQCRSLDSLMPQWCWLIQIEGILGQLFINQPFGKYDCADFLSNWFRIFKVILKRGEVENLFKRASSCLFYAIIQWISTIFEYFPIINFWLFCMKENIKLCMPKMPVRRSDPKAAHCDRGCGCSYSLCHESRWGFKWPKGLGGKVESPLQLSPAAWLGGCHTEFLLVRALREPTKLGGRRPGHRLRRSDMN